MELTLKIYFDDSEVEAAKTLAFLAKRLGLPTYVQAPYLMLVEDLDTAKSIFTDIGDSLSEIDTRDWCESVLRTRVGGKRDFLTGMTITTDSYDFESNFENRNPDVVKSTRDIKRQYDIVEELT